MGCDVETDLDTLYSRDDVDAVIVATPNYLHKEPVVKAAEHGVNVFCEKPIALSYQDCDDMVRACQEHGVIFMARWCYRKSTLLSFSTKWMGRTAANYFVEKD